jgi:enamine deaminase RidA (YjgF/YER057c/UK114 family)
MASTIEQRLTRLGITLPAPGAPAGNYVPFVRTGSLVFLAGQVTRLDGKMVHVGKVGRDVSVEEGRQAARVCALNLLAQLKVACDGDLDRVARCVRLGGFVNCTAEFDEQPKVVNGASDLMVELFGERGKHARTAVGVNALPLNATVEVEAVFELAP